MVRSVTAHFNKSLRLIRTACLTVLRKRQRNHFDCPRCASTLCFDIDDAYKLDCLCLSIIIFFSCHHVTKVIKRKRRLHS